MAKNMDEDKKLDANDHRRLGRELELFFISPSVGSGLPLLMPRGETVKNELMKYMRAKEEAMGYQYVSTPVLAQQELYKRSGHADYYLENMYATQPDEDGNVFYLKPMNCPHHHMIFEQLVKSYRDLPLILAEHAGLYRYELSGVLTGLIRVRGPITQNDSHTYVTEEQVEEHFIRILNLFHEVYRETGVKDYWFRLSLPDFTKHKYTGDKKAWEEAAETIRHCLKATNSKYVEEKDEAAFYGPKLDVQIKNVNGKEDSIATVQVDIVVPERMGLVYVDKDGKDRHPVIIHTAIMGSFERFMAFLLEQNEGKFPVWLAPEQIRVVTLNDEANTLKTANNIVKKASEHGLRVTLDDSAETLSKKILQAEKWHVPYTIVVGPIEADSGQVEPRVRKDLKPVKAMPVDDFLMHVSDNAQARR